MQKLKRGRSISLTAHRVMVCDLLHFSRQIPSIPVQRRMRLGSLVAAREESSMRPTWVALFTYSFANVAAVMPELRRSYIPFP